MNVASPERQSGDEMWGNENIEATATSADAKKPLSTKKPYDGSEPPCLIQYRLRKEQKERVKRLCLSDPKEPTSEPPDINYRRLVLSNRDIIKRLFDDERLHFEDRYLRYEEEDAYLELCMLKEYTHWTKYMVEDARASRNQMRDEFFSELLKEVTGDEKDQLEEWAKLNAQNDEREREKAISALNLPCDESEYTRKIGVACIV